MLSTKFQSILYFLLLLFLATSLFAGEIDQLTKEAEGGKAEAQYKLGSAYENGNHTAKDYAKARHWYQLAAEQGFADAQRSLGVLYELGQGGGSDPQKAVFWYQKAADQGLPRAMVNLGILYETGKGVAGDFQQALYWYKKSTEQKYGRGMYHTGHIYEKGLGVEQDNTLALSWYKESAAQRYPRAPEAIKRLLDMQSSPIIADSHPEHIPAGDIAEDKTPSPEPTPAADIAADKTTSPEQTPVTDIAADKTPSPEPTSLSETAQPQKTDGQEILELQQAAKDGKIDAQLKLAAMYFEDDAAGQDYKAAAEWLEKAAWQGSSVAQSNLGQMHINGIGVAKDLGKALFWLDKAAKQGDLSAQNNLGVMYSKGFGVEKDIDKALEWLMKAADQGGIDAQYNLASIYFNGKDLERDLTAAVFWLQKAAAQGDAEASEMLRIIQQGTDGNGQAATEQLSDNQQKNLETTTQSAEAQSPSSPPPTPVQLAAEHFYRGNSYAHEGKFALAITEFKESLTFDPDNANTHENLAILYAQNGFYADAIGHMNNAIRLSPGDSTKLANLGIIYHSNDGQDQALVFYKKALNLNPGLAWVYNKMAYIYYLRRDYGKAAKSALLGRELGDPDQPLLDALQLSVGKEMPETADVKQTEEHLRQIVVPSVQQAEEIQGLLNTGSDFSQLAAQNSLPQYSLNGGYVGPLKVQDPAGEIMENVRELPMFATSRVFKTAQGFHLYQKFPVAPELLTFEGN